MNDRGSGTRRPVILVSFGCSGGVRGLDALNWALALAPMLVVLLTILAVLRRRGEVRAYARRHLERLEAKERGSDRARLQQNAFRC